MSVRENENPQRSDDVHTVSTVEASGSPLGPPTPEAVTVEEVAQTALIGKKTVTVGTLRPVVVTIPPTSSPSDPLPCPDPSTLSGMILSGLLSHRGTREGRKEAVSYFAEGHRHTRTCGGLSTYRTGRPPGPRRWTPDSTTEGTLRRATRGEGYGGPRRVVPRAWSGPDPRPPTPDLTTPTDPPSLVRHCRRVCTRAHQDRDPRGVMDFNFLKFLL